MTEITPTDDMVYCIPKLWICPNCNTQNHEALIKCRECNTLQKEDKKVSDTARNINLVINNRRTDEKD